VIGPKATQIDRLCAWRKAVRVLIIVGGAEILRERRHHVGDRAITVVTDIIGGDDNHRRRAFRLRTRNARSGHFHGVEFGRCRAVARRGVLRIGRRIGGGQRLSTT